MAPIPVPPSSTFDWSKLAFDLYPTNGYAKYIWRDGQWGSVEWVKEPYLTLHVGSVALNYGASCFEGIKAFRHPDQQVRIFRPQVNAGRMNHSAQMVSMPDLPEEIFLEGIKLAVGRNLELVPANAPYGASGSMYIRPLYFASGANLILSTPKEFTFIVYVTPTGSLYGTAGSKAPAVDALVVDDFDRAAPKGTGTTKLAGNYSPAFKIMANAKKAGYPITLHLDATNRTHIDEFSTSNFLAILKRSQPSDQRTLIVPVSGSILKSVTTRCIVEIAKSFGWAVEERPVEFEEVVQGKFEEVCACGTAAAITPIRSISYHDPTSKEEDSIKKIDIGDGKEAGDGFLQILKQLTGIQSGVVEDQFGWTWPKEGVDGSK